MWGELAEITARATFYLLQKVPRDQEIPGGWEETDVTLITRMGRQADLGSQLLINLPSVPWNILE